MEMGNGKFSEFIHLLQCEENVVHYVVKSSPLIVTCQYCYIILTSLLWVV